MKTRRMIFPLLGLAAALACGPSEPAPSPLPEPAPAVKLVVTSPAFEAGGAYPSEFTCDGAGVSPPIEWSGAPEGTRCYALSLWHIPRDGAVKSYWVLYNIPGDVTGLPRNATKIGVAGVNDKDRAAYDPMCSKGPGAKVYQITVHALSAELKPSSRRLNRSELLTAIEGIELARGTLSYTYTRPRPN